MQNDEGQKGRSDNADSMVKPPLSFLMCTRPQELSDNRAFILDTATEKTLEEDLLADDCSSIGNESTRTKWDKKGFRGSPLKNAYRKME